MKVSVVLPNYNKAKYIEETLMSLKRQSFTDWEAIVIDDASTDESVGLIKKFAESDCRFKLIESKIGIGVSAARNVGIRHAKGKYLMFLDSDDIITEDCLAQRVAAMQSDESLHCVLANMGTLKNGIYIDDTLIVKNEDMLVGFLAHKMPFTVMQPLWLKSFVDRLNGCDEKYRCLDDVEFNTRAFFEKDFRFKILGGKCDCYYRNDSDRSLSIDMHEKLNRKLDGIRYYVKDMMRFVNGINDSSRRGTLCKALRKTVFVGVGDLTGNLRMNAISQDFANQQFVSLRRTAREQKCMGLVSCAVLMAYYNIGKRMPHRIKGFNYVFREILSILGGVIDFFNYVIRHCTIHKEDLLFQS